MPATWFYVVGGIVIGLLVFTIAYNLISVMIIQAQKQAALSNFNSFHFDLETVCLEEINNSMQIKLEVSPQVRVVYVTNDIINPLPMVIDNITKEDTNKDRNLCMQFQDEQILRCKELTCNVTLPYMGILPESMDIKEYSFTGA